MQAATIQRMPWVIDFDFDFLPDMGRMTMRLSSGAGIGCSQTPKAPALALRPFRESLLATAKLNGLEPYTWLKDTLEKLPAWPYRRIDELLSLRPVTDQ
jgi:hypothetical protein